MRPSITVSFLAVLMLAGCATGRGEDRDDVARGHRLIEQARQSHGSAALDNASVEFTFRGDRYVADRENGRFMYTRIWRDEDGREIHDRLSNDGVERLVDGQQVTLEPAEALAAEERVNSVVYFALLPYNLTDSSVRARHVGTDTLRGEPYEAVEVTFEEEGGGRDWEDRFVYWIHRENGTMDYLAYRYHTNTGGTRFREAYNPRVVNGVRFADFRNYAFADGDRQIEDYPARLADGGLRLVSEIVLDSVRVVRR
jgi:hypothetical protein